MNINKGMAITLVLLSITVSILFGACVANYLTKEQELDLAYMAGQSCTLESQLKMQLMCEPHYRDQIEKLAKED